MVFLDVEKYSTIRKLIFDNMDTNILRKCPFIAYCVAEFETVFMVSYFGIFRFKPPIAPNKNTNPI